MESRDTLESERFFKGDVRDRGVETMHIGGGKRFALGAQDHSRPWNRGKMYRVDVRMQQPQCVQF